VLQRQVESTHYSSEQFQELLADHGVICSVSRSGNVCDNAAMESLFSSLKTKRTARKVYRTRDQARADVFDYIERFYNPRRRHSSVKVFAVSRSPVAVQNRPHALRQRAASKPSSVCANTAR